MKAAKASARLLAGVLFLAAPLASAQTPQGTSFTYQGRLSDNGSPANGTYDLRFALFDAPASGTQVGASSTLEDVAVTAGLFTVTLDFGSAPFAGSARWLAVAARPGASTGTFTPVGPFQRLTSTPAAIYGATTPWTGILGKPAGFADDVDNDSGGDITAVTAGAGLTGGAATGEATLAVGFGGSGSATTVSRTDHDHLGQTWNGTTAATGLTVSVTASTALQGQTSNAFNNANGVFGLATATTANTNGVHGRSQSSVGRGVFGEATSTVGSAVGVLGSTSSTVGAGVSGLTTNTAGAANGVSGISSATGGAGVFAQGATGVLARSVTNGGTGIFAEAPNTSGNNEAIRAEVRSPDGIGVYGRALATSQGPTGVYGSTVAPDGRGVVGNAGGVPASGVGVYGLVFSTIGFAGYFDGNVHIAGILTRPDEQLEIDHPLDPESRVLRHAAIASDERKNVYDGVVTTDADGYAAVQLPGWFGALNRDFRYQLTVVDESDAPGFVQVKVVRGIADNRFAIRSSAPGTRVSWQVTGVRQDRFAVSRPLAVEEAKPESERGSYLQPDAFGEPRAKGRSARRWPDDERLGRR